MSRALTLAGFQVTFIGRFWVITEANNFLVSAHVKVSRALSLLASFCRETRILAEKFDWAIEISVI
jgi:hypothetical protein